MSGLKLVGEDPYSAERKKMQALQMQRWCDQQTTLKSFEAEKAAKAEAKYLRDLADQEALRSRVEEERLAEQKRLQDQVREANRLSAQQRRESDSRERARTLQAAGSLVTTEDLLAQGAERGGEFKGLTPELKARIKAENERQMAEAAERKRREKEEAEADGKMRRDQALYAQRQQMLDQEEKRREREAHMAALQMQAQEKKALEEAEKRRQGSDDMRGFFDGFGKSSR